MRCKGGGWDRIGAGIRQRAIRQDGREAGAPRPARPQRERVDVQLSAGAGLRVTGLPARVLRGHFLQVEIALDHVEHLVVNAAGTMQAQ